MIFGRHRYLLALAVIVIASVLSPAAQAQGPILVARMPDAPMPDAPTPATAFVEPVVIRPRAETHKFWDNENRGLFLTAAALNGADFAVTRANLQNGGQELNPIVRVFGRSSAGLAVNFVGETAGVITLSYFFHKTGHHKLERAVSTANIGLSAGAVAYGLTHR